jgi:hypothetical protein
VPQVDRKRLKAIHCGSPYTDGVWNYYINRLLATCEKQAIKLIFEKSGAGLKFQEGQSKSAVSNIGTINPIRRSGYHP